MMRLRRARQQPNQLLQAADGGVILSALERRARLSHQLTGRLELPLLFDRDPRFLELGGAFRPLSGACERKAELITSGAELWIELNRLPELRDRVGQRVLLEEQLSELEARGRERRL